MGLGKSKRILVLGYCRGFQCSIFGDKTHTHNGTFKEENGSIKIYSEENIKEFGRCGQFERGQMNSSFDDKHCSNSRVERGLEASIIRGHDSTFYVKFHVLLLGRIFGKIA